MSTLNPMTDAAPKGALSSKTIVGSLAVLIALGCQYAGYDIEVETIGATINEIVAAAGSVLAIVGRKSATRPVSLSKLI